MENTDNTFDINMALMMLFSSLEKLRLKKNIELIYEIDSSIPKELRGDVMELSKFLTRLLMFVFENTQNQEIVLSLVAPKDFMYEEPIVFKLQDIDVNGAAIASFVNDNLQWGMKVLNINNLNATPTSFQISIPFKLGELGERRHYRLADESMLNKKVLLICDSPKVAKSIEKMFHYFNYDVVVGLNEYKNQGSNLTEYDIFLIEDKLATRKLEKMILDVQRSVPLEYVLLHDACVIEDKHKHIECSYLIKPVMQESIFELITLLFTEKVKDANFIFGNKDITINMDKYIDEKFQKNNIFNKKDSALKDKLNNDINPHILDVELGEIHAKKLHIPYNLELNKFLEYFSHSDHYFRELVNEKKLWKIKDFCNDLEKHSKIIGAESMIHFLKEINRLFIYNHLDQLPSYIDKYHKELITLNKEINKRLKHPQIDK